MRCDLASLLVIALRASGGSGAHAQAARQVVLFVLFAQLLAAQHDGPPHAAQRAPRQVRARRSRRPHMQSLSGRRPRG